MKARLCESVCWLVFAGIMAVGFGDSAFGDEARPVDLASWITPLDPFGWQYLVVKRENGEVTHRNGAMSH